MLAVVSGHTVVHWESVNARMTTLPRNWLTSRKPGAGSPPSEVPGSRSGLAAAARACPLAAGAAGFAVPVTLVPHAVTASTPARKPIRSGIRHRIRPPGLVRSTAVILPCARRAQHSTAGRGGQSAARTRRPGHGFLIPGRAALATVASVKRAVPALPPAGEAGDALIAPRPRGRRLIVAVLCAMVLVAG